MILTWDCWQPQSGFNQRRRQQSLICSNKNMTLSLVWFEWNTKFIWALKKKKFPLATLDYCDQGTVICILPRLWSRWAGLRRACGSYIRLIPALFVITTWFTGLGAFLSSTTSASHQHTARECIWSAPCHTEPTWKTAGLQINWWNNNKMRWYSAYWDGYTGWNSFISKILASQNLALIWRWVIYFILFFFCVTRFVCFI